MKLLTKEQILGAKDLVKEELEISEWGGMVTVRTLTGAERDLFEREVFIDGDVDKRNMENFRAKLVSLTLIDSEGNRMFSFDDLKALGSKSACALDKVFAVAQRLAGLRKEDVEELTKN